MMGDEILAAAERAVRETRSGEAWIEMVGCESPRRTRLMDVGE